MKIGLEMGVTMHIGNPQQNEYFRCTVRVDEIDPSLPVGEQLDTAEHTLVQVAEVVLGELNRQIRANLQA